MVTKKERLEAAIAGEMADRPPVALWRHFPVDDQEPTELARSTAHFQQRYDFDFVKVTPSSSFCLKDWGSMDRWQGATEGTREYTHRVISQPQEWAELQELDPNEGYLAEQLANLRQLRQLLGENTPIIQTIFSPLAQAKNLAGGERLLSHLHKRPDLVQQGLIAITNSTVAFVEEAKKTGIDGIFYAIQHASYGYFDRESYKELAERDDLKILETASDLWLNVLHLHGGDLMFDLAEYYPAHVLNWHVLTEGPGFEEARSRVKGALCGGLRRHQTLVLGDPDSVRQEADLALKVTGGEGFILGAGCVTPTIAPAANLRAARRVVENFA